MRGVLTHEKGGNERGSRGGKTWEGERGKIAGFEKKE